MRKILVAIVLGIIVSFFFYPLDFTFLPAGLNTKKMLAALGLVIYCVKVLQKEDRGVNLDLVFSVFLAVAFSLACFFSETRAGTDDGSYTTYFVSFFVWIFAGYAVCSLLRRNYGTVSLKTVTYYLAAVAVFQCLASQMIDSYPSVQLFVDRFTAQNQDELHSMNRLYGLGASLDNGGVRFAITLLLLSHFIYETARMRGHRLEFAILCVTFAVLTVYGNMIARTTTVGALLGLAYIGVMSVMNASFVVKKSVFKSVLMVALIVAVLIPLLAYLYVTNSAMHENLRFAFEGFFNWVETGQFQVDSLDKLNGNMWIWPRDERTWLIGTGLFGNWVYGTDIGYCRFILYCGLLGFSIFSVFFIHNAASFHRKFKKVGMLALFLLALTFVIWVKVSTDIFQIYALLICADAVVYDAPAPMDNKV